MYKPMLYRVLKVRRVVQDCLVWMVARVCRVQTDGQEVLELLVNQASRVRRVIQGLGVRMDAPVAQVCRG